MSDQTLNSIGNICIAVGLGSLVFVLLVLCVVLVVATYDCFRNNGWRK